MQPSLNLVNNPTDEQRHRMLKEACESAGRPEDYDLILQYLSPPPEITSLVPAGALKGIKIGIIGGGLAGLASAYELRKLGADITILEANAERIGGRVYTFYFDSSGQYYGDFGAMRVPVSHETSWHYINLFGLDTISLIPPKRNNFYYVHNVRIRSTDSVEQYIYPKYDLTPEERNTPWRTLKEYADSYRYMQLSAEARSQLIRILPDYSPEFLPLTEISLRQNYEMLGLSQGAIEMISGLDPSSGALLSVSYADIASDDYSFDFLNTYSIQGGMIRLPLAFYDSFKSKNPPGYSSQIQAYIGNVSYRSGHIVTGIYLSDYKNKIVLKYRNRADGNDAADIFDYVICAIPLTALRTIDIRPRFSNSKMQAIMEQYYTDALKAQFLFNRRFWERNTDYGNIVGGISFTDLPIQSIIYPSHHNSCLPDGRCSSEEPGVLLASYNLAQNSVRLGGMYDSLRYETIRQNVEEVHGLPRGFLNPFIQYHKIVHWYAEPLFRGAFTLDLPGQKRLFSFELLQPEYNGRLYLAGEHASAKHGWIQGALYSAKDATNRLAMHLINRYV